MNEELFHSLKGNERDAMIIAMHVRNEMEDFHVKHLTDTQMAELNPIIRTAIYEALFLMDRIRKHAYNHVNDGKIKIKDLDASLGQFYWLVSCIPDYWEIPNSKNLEKVLAECQKKYYKDKKFSGNMFI